MSKVTFSRTDGKRSKVELVVDRKVVDQAYISAEDPVAFFSAEYVDMTDKEDAGETLSEKIREKNIRRAEAYLCEFFQLLARINETDPEAVQELLEIIIESAEGSMEDVEE